MSTGHRPCRCRVRHSYWGRERASSRLPQSRRRTRTCRRRTSHAANGSRRDTSEHSTGHVQWLRSLRRSGTSRRRICRAVRTRRPPRRQPPDCTRADHTSRRATQARTRTYPRRICRARRTLMRSRAWAAAHGRRRPQRQLRRSPLRIRLRRSQERMHRLPVSRRSVRGRVSPGSRLGSRGGACSHRLASRCCTSTLPRAGRRHGRCSRPGKPSARI